MDREGAGDSNKMYLDNLGRECVFGRKADNSVP